ncbi:hypothetical protein WMY93_000409 [Mugilogobius chulae]|uniref:Pex N-terminal domain-containing protein n=1 Tax=Mugilogobius chulae TaxID=88201 RepID=A0AAW0Q0V3_9GOBI
MLKVSGSTKHSKIDKKIYSVLICVTTVRWLREGYSCRPGEPREPADLSCRSEPQIHTMKQNGIRKCHCYQTLGEEYVNILRVDLSQRRVPSVSMRSVFVLCHCLVPYLLERVLQCVERELEPEVNVGARQVREREREREGILQCVERVLEPEVNTGARQVRERERERERGREGGRVLQCVERELEPEVNVGARQSK